MKNAGIYVAATMCANAFIVASLIAYATKGVKPNTTAGYRNKYTKTDPEVWEENNRRCGRVMVLWGGVCAVLCLLPLLYPSHVVLLTVVIGSLVPWIGTTVYYHFESRRLYFLRHPEEGPQPPHQSDPVGRKSSLFINALAHRDTIQK
jgi:hypothetical protein